LTRVRARAPPGPPARARFAPQLPARFNPRHRLAPGNACLEARPLRLTGKRARASAGSDDDDVVVIGHHSSRRDGQLQSRAWPGQTIASGATHAPVAPRSLAWEMTSRNSRTPALAISPSRRFS